jgi:predicted metalloprotease with PDZ domain
MLVLNAASESHAPVGEAANLKPRIVMLLLCVLFVLRGVARGGEPPINYLIDLREPSTHLVLVTMTVPRAPASAEIQFPAWNNLYQIRDFVRTVQELRAECDGSALELRREDQETWRTGARPCAQLTLRYKVYAHEESSFSNILSESHAFLNFALLCFYLPQQRNREVRVKFLLPPDWRIATLLESRESSSDFGAPDFDTLADSPTEAGKFQDFSYTQKGANYRVIVQSEGATVPTDRLLGSLSRITATATALMRDVPFSQYTFIFHFLSEGSMGGMEHRNGTAINLSGHDVERNWASLEDVAAHEFFHLWNVKRIRPQRLEPIDYVHGNDTRDLWFSEGLTSTYGVLTTLRAGLLNREDFYWRLAQEIQQLQDRPARLFQSAEDCGREAWLEKYPDYFRPQRSISYYNKGELLGFLLDLALRHASHNQASLDDVMRQLNTDFARRHRFFTSADLRAVIEKVVPAYRDFESFDRDYIRGTQELDYEKFLEYAGLRLVTHMRERAEPGFLAVQTFDGPIQVESVSSDSGAARAGLQRGDVLLKLDEQELTSLPLSQLDSAKPGQTVKLHVRRERQKLDIEFVAGGKQQSTYRVEEVAHPSAEQLRVRQGWLEGKTDPPEG